MCCKSFQSLPVFATLISKLVVWHCLGEGVTMTTSKKKSGSCLLSHDLWIGVHSHWRNPSTGLFHNLALSARRRMQMPHHTSSAETLFPLVIDHQISPANEGFKVFKWWRICFGSNKEPSSEQSFQIYINYRCMMHVKCHATFAGFDKITS